MGRTSARVHFRGSRRILEAQREAIAMDGTVWCCRHPRWGPLTSTANPSRDDEHCERTQRPTRCVCVCVCRRGSPPTQKNLVLYLYLYTCNWLLVSRAACALAPARRLALRARPPPGPEVQCSGAGARGHVHQRAIGPWPCGLQLGMNTCAGFCASGALFMGRVCAWCLGRLRRVDLAPVPVGAGG